VIIQQQVLQNMPTEHRTCNSSNLTIRQRCYLLIVFEKLLQSIAEISRIPNKVPFADF